MTWQVWSLFVLTEAALCVTPGPAVLLVLSQALARGARQSVWSACGILAANGFYFALSATSLGAILLASYNLFFAVKWIGAGYLIYLGVRAIASKEPVLAIPAAKATRAGNWRTFADGVALQLSNPKALLFFSAILPQFLNARAPIVPQMAILGTSSIVVEFFVLLGYGMLAGRASQWARQPRYAKLTNQVAGGMLIAAGTALAAVRRSRGYW